MSYSGIPEYATNATAIELSILKTLLIEASLKDLGDSLLDFVDDDDGGGGTGGGTGGGGGGTTTGGVSQTDFNELSSLVQNLRLVLAQTNEHLSTIDTLVAAETTTRQDQVSDLQNDINQIVLVNENQQLLIGNLTDAVAQNAADIVNLMAAVQDQATINQAQSQTIGETATALGNLTTTVTNMATTISSIQATISANGESQAATRVVLQQMMSLCQQPIYKVNVDYYGTYALVAGSLQHCIAQGGTRFLQPVITSENNTISAAPIGINGYYLISEGDIKVYAYSSVSFAAAGGSVVDPTYATSKLNYPEIHVNLTALKNKINAAPVSLYEFLGVSTTGITNPLNSDFFDWSVDVSLSGHVNSNTPDAPSYLMGYFCFSNAALYTTPHDQGQAITTAPAGSRVYDWNSKMKRFAAVAATYDNITGMGIFTLEDFYERRRLTDQTEVHIGLLVWVALNEMLIQKKYNDYMGGTAGGITTCEVRVNLFPRSYISNLSALFDDAVAT